MNVNRLPRLLDRWLEQRGFVWGARYSDHELHLNEDEIYSAAVECLDDCDTDGNLWNDASESDKATLRRFVWREEKTHRLLALPDWYWKGA